MSLRGCRKKRWNIFREQLREKDQVMKQYEQANLEKHCDIQTKKKQLQELNQQLAVIQEAKRVQEMKIQMLQ